MAYGWGGIAAEYDVSFARMCEGAISAVLAAVGAPAPGGRLLDAGCGTGMLAACASDSGWQVDAVDIEADMIAFATSLRSRAAIRYSVASLAQLPFPNAAFDAVAANFSVNHAAYPADCVRELHRVARPGAPIAATVWPWQPTELNQLWAGIMDETGTRPERIEIPPGSDFARTEDGLAGLLADGGFRDAAAARLDWTFAISPADLWSGVAAGIATIGQAYTSTDDAGRARIRGAYDAAMSVRVHADGLLRFPSQAILAAATA